jgi:hypothetical protein
MSHLELEECGQPGREEASRVEAWRLKVLLEAGYGIAEADRIARSLEVDLHGAVELVRAGCPPIVAAEILL